MDEWGGLSGVEKLDFATDLIMCTVTLLDETDVLLVVLAVWSFGRSWIAA